MEQGNERQQVLDFWRWLCSRQDNFRQIGRRLLQGGHWTDGGDVALLEGGCLHLHVLDGSTGEEWDLSLSPEETIEELRRWSDLAPNAGANRLRDALIERAKAQIGGDA